MRHSDVDSARPTFTATTDMTTATVRAGGELDAVAAGLFQDAVELLTNAGHSVITVDLAELARIDTAGLRMLVSIVRKLSAVHGHLTITNPTPAVRAALMLSGTGLAQPPRDGPP